MRGVLLAGLSFIRVKSGVFHQGSLSSRRVFFWQGGLSLRVFFFFFFLPGWCGLSLRCSFAMVVFHRGRCSFARVVFH